MNLRVSGVRLRRKHEQAAVQIDSLIQDLKFVFRTLSGDIQACNGVLFRAGARVFSIRSGHEHAALVSAYAPMGTTRSKWQITALLATVGTN